MQASTTTFTVAEYCRQMEAGTLKVNRDYQRSPKRWPAAARSFLIDTILNRYPIPKLSLHQKTDLKSRKTTYEIVDGQQRSVAIYDFYKGDLRITEPSELAGSTYAQLEEPLQRAFVEYPLSIDLFTGATDAQIREVFRRINSYTVPLNDQETRHAVYQGQFKWFIFHETSKYAETLKTLGVFREQQLSAMADGALLTEFCRTILDGIATAREAKLNRFYEDREDEFPERDELETRLHETFAEIVKYEDIHNGPLMKAFSLLTLILAISHTLRPAQALNRHFPRDQRQPIDTQVTATNLSALSAALDASAEEGRFAEFVKACSKGTNTERNRTTRFIWFCRALDDTMAE